MLPISLPLEEWNAFKVKRSGKEIKKTKKNTNLHNLQQSDL